jgi:hypothetical protein
LTNDIDPGHATSRRPSALWTALAVVIVAGAIVSMVSAVHLIGESQRPVGEGELFRAEAGRVAEILGDVDEISEDDLRHIRNDLTIEAVGLVGPDGVVEASTSAPAVGSPLASPILSGFVERARFGAAAVPLAVPVELDGMREWTAGDVVYDVVHPLPDGRSVLLTYDISELLARGTVVRASPGRQDLSRVPARVRVSPA